ncbi:nitroreductase family protein [Halobium palmae]|uniref:Nitroreductase family protein n=1 Tax=Halobium palmae TaxID=1776492 RepID=A0ABD5RUC3_9EURY
MEYIENEGKRSNPTHRRAKYTHMIEKGLSTPNRRDVFAEGFIQDLVPDVITAWEKSDDPLADDRLLWSIDVIDTYFHVAGETEIINKFRKEFREFLEDIEYTPENRTPRRRKEVEQNPVSYEELCSLSNQRSSTRWFQDKEVPRGELDKAIQIAAKAPSACNKQSFEFRIYDDETVLDDLFDLRVGLNSFKDTIPCYVVVVGKYRAYEDDREKNSVHIDASLAAMSFQYALETLGLAACMVNWPAILSDHHKISEILGLDADEMIITTMAVGYPDPDSMIPYSSKKDLSSLRSYNSVDD